MKHFLFTLAFFMPFQAAADGYVLGPGRWTCDEIVRVYQEGTGTEKAQLAGWILGYWTAATFERETAFIDIVETTGGMKIAEATVVECNKADADTLLYQVTQSMIRNTK